MLNEFEGRPATFIGNQTVCHSAAPSNTRFPSCATIEVCFRGSPSGPASESSVCWNENALDGPAPASLAQTADYPVAVLQFLEYYGLPQHGITKWEYLGIEFLFFIMFFILAWVALKYKKHGNR